MLSWMFKGKHRGVISIFLLIILVPMLVFSTFIMEIGRYQSAKEQLSEAVDNATTSIIAAYNKELYKSYGVYAFDETDKKEIKKTFYGYLKTNCNIDVGEEYTTNSSEMLEISNYDVSQLYPLSDYNVLSRQIQEYVKYRAPEALAEKIMGALIDKDEIIKKLSESVLGDSGEKVVKSIKSFAKTISFLTEAVELQQAVGNIQVSISGKTTLTNEFISIVTKTLTGENIFDESVTPYSSTRAALINSIEAKNSFVSKHKVDTEGKNDSDSYKTFFEDREKKLKAMQKLGNEMVPFLKQDGVDNKASLWQQIFPGQAWDETSEFYEYTKELSIDENTSVEDVLGKFFDYNLNYNITSATSITKDNLEKLLKNIKEMLKTKAQKYANELSNLDNEITVAIGEFTKSIQNVSTKLGKYKDKIEPMYNSLASSVDDILDTINVMNVDTTDISKDLQNMIANLNLDKTKEGITYINGLKAQAETLNIGDISVKKMNELFPISSPEKNTFSEYYMSPGVALNVSKKLDTVVFFSGSMKESPLYKIISGLSDLLKIANPVMYTNDSSKNDTITTAVKNTLPSHITANMANENSSEDSNTVDNLAEEAQGLVPSQYLDDIKSVTATAKEEDNSLWETIQTKMSNTAKDFQTLSSVSSSFFSGMQSATILKFLLSFKDIIASVVDMVSNMVFFVQHISEVVDALISNLKESIYVNYYISDKMKCRLDDKPADKIEDDSVPIFTAQQEYILNGKASEVENQKDIYYKIFFLRLINNVIVALTDSTFESVMSVFPVGTIISILWVYYETNMDMNMLVRVPTTVPFIKTKLIISEETLNNLDSFNSNVGDYWKHINTSGYDQKKLKAETKTLMKQEKEVTGEVTGKTDSDLLNFTYQEYLILFGCFVSNKTKVKRIGDIIQMQTRYDEFKKSGKSEFLMNKAYTYIRAEAKGNLKPFLPVQSLSGSMINLASLSLKEVYYNGY